MTKIVTRPAEKKSPSTMKRGLKIAPNDKVSDTSAASRDRGPNRPSRCRGRDDLEPMLRSLPCRRRSNQRSSEPEQCGQRLSTGWELWSGPDSIKIRADASGIGSPHRPQRSRESLNDVGTEAENDV
jgi:hypothetical protein